MIGIQLFQVTIDVRASLLGIAAVSLCLNDITVARHPFHGSTKIWVRSILVGEVEEGNAAVQRVAHQACKSLLPQSRLIRSMCPTTRASADAHQRNC